jgi:hypothetical protein
MRKGDRTDIPMSTVDYLVLYGMPILFLALATFLVSLYLGQAPQVGVVQRIRNGAVRPGMTEQEVLQRAGPPKGVVNREDGGFTYRYQSSAWDPERRVPIEEDAYIDFSSSGVVGNVTFDSRVPDPATSTESPAGSSGSTPAGASAGSPPSPRS